MATVTIPTFGGEVPRTMPRILAQTQASIAINCELQRGALEPLTGPKHTQDLPDTSKTIFKHAHDGWLSWRNHVYVVKSAVTDLDGEKPLGHLFITGDRAYPTQYLAGGEVYRLGIPRPAKAPTIKVAKNIVPVKVFAFGGNSKADLPARYGQDSLYPEIEERGVNVDGVAEDREGDDITSTDSGIARSSAYCYTYVQKLANDIIQQESAPSPPTDVLDVMDGGGVEITGFEIPNLEGLKITHIRIYRTSSGMQSSEFHLLVELPVPVEKYVDTVSDKNLSTEVLQTTMWDCIPDDAQGLINTDNGLYACYRGNELLISEPFIAYAYPTAYRITTEDPIVALGHTDNTIVVLTTGRPYLAAGAEPESLQITHLPIEQACVSPRSLGCLPGGVVYASPDGLMLFTSGDQRLVTGQTFTREQWQALRPETLMGAVHDSRYVGFFEGTNTGLILNIGAADVVRIELPKDWKVHGIYHHSQDDCIYLSVETAKGNSVFQWQAGEPMAYVWRSKPFFSSVLTCPTALRVEMERDAGRELTASFFGPDAKRPRTRMSIMDSKAKRLTPMRAEKLWSVELRGKATVHEVRFGGSVEGVEYGQ